MKTKFLPLIFSIFLVFALASVSAVVTYAEWSDGSSSITINNGQSITFNVDLFTLEDGMTVNLHLFNSQGNLLHAFEQERAIAGNSYFNSYTVTSALYQTPGSYTIVLTATDDFPSSDGYFLTFTVAGAPGNTAPTITSTPVTTVAENAAYTYDVDATDAQNNVLTYSLTEAPNWLTINAQTGLITGTAPAVTADTPYSVVVSVSDGTATTTQAYTLTVNNVATPGNTPPSITSTPVTTVAENAAYSYQVTATDAENNALTYTLTGPSWLSISSTGLVSGTAPAVAANTNFNVVVSVSDGTSTTTQAYTLTVTDVPAGNNPPLITTTPATSVNENTAYTYDVDATDADGDTLTYSISGASWLSIDSATGLVSGTSPTVTANTDFDVTITVSDGNGGTATQEYTLTVFDGIIVPGNNPPLINSSPITTVNEGAGYGYQVVATDADNDTLTYTVSGPSWLSIDSAGLVTGIAPAVTANTDFNVTITVDDGNGGTATQTYTITVRNTGSSSSGSKGSSGGTRILLGNGLDEERYVSQFAPKTVVADDSAELASETGSSKVWVISFWVIVFIALIALGAWLIARLLR